MKKILSLFLFLSIIAFSTSAYSYDLKHINDKRCMTNSCVISLSQDVLGRMWIGTCDGINLYDGHEITAFNIKGKENYISGNLIDNIYTTNNQIYLVQNRFALRKCIPHILFNSSLYIPIPLSIKMSIGNHICRILFGPSILSKNTATYKRCGQ